jgi:hypothetical protein
MVSFRMKSSLLLLGKPHVRQERKEGRKERMKEGNKFRRVSFLPKIINMGSRIDRQPFLKKTGPSYHFL